MSIDNIILVSEWLYNYGSSLHPYILYNIVSNLFPDDDEELMDRNCECCGKCCLCYIPWLRFQSRLHFVVNSFVFEMVSSIFIALNVVVLSMAYHGMSETYAKVLEDLNVVRNIDKMIMKLPFFNHSCLRWNMIGWL